MRNRVKTWDNIRKSLKKEFEEKGITRCEICGSDWNLSFAHKEKRRKYYSRIKGEEERKLGDFNEVLLLCTDKCHRKIEDDRKLTEYWFSVLRNN
ncbi:MAG: hypothetical protein EOM19_06990 [Candidatus Moranbacteria bacterium]|nr:hypothetical protein [Candidatus Moranbacteria bacterium]